MEAKLAGAPDKVSVWLYLCGYPCSPVSYTHLRAHETDQYLVCRLLLEKKKILLVFILFVMLLVNN